MVHISANLRRETIIFGLFVLCAFQTFIIYHLTPFFTSTHVPEQVKSKSPTTAVLPAQIQEILSSNTTFVNFGYVARHVTQLAKLAEKHVKGSETDSTLLDLAVQKLFPWWQPEAQLYYPWMRGSRFSREPKVEQKTGIIMSIGNNNVRNAAIAIAVLRNVLDSTLPIQIAYIGDKDLSPHWRTFLQRMANSTDFSTVDLTQIFDDGLVSFKGWDTKPFALLASRFPQTILMDADALFFTRPDDMFTVHPALKETGTLYFRDRAKWWTQPPDRRSWILDQIAAAGRKPSESLNSSSFFWQGFTTEHQDSSVVMVDKSRPQQYIAMLFAAWMNAKDAREVTYKKVYGDKELYWLAGEFTGIPYSFEAWSSARFTEDDNAGSLALSPSNPAQATSCTEHMVHANFDGESPLFANDGVWRNKKSADGMVFANWTRWHLGVPVTEAITTAKSKMNLLYSAPEFEQTISESEKKTYQAIVMSKQTQWGGGCEQHHPDQWKPLTASFKHTLRAIHAETKKVVTRYEAESKAANP
ncbi:glycosyltransferase family 71 protein [Myriangium duriaei CBS 260.36]|uniref:Glycosyltransferase family 71 protein n=1 Tax=Myriangium duriaei CBS 260.36 TaxID=1168546 RepID=A0A9P4MGD5_9PEZI|nr:glycosyltransferase family 71 protein [Myriangium duriaei CBS 260.36]